MGASTGGKVTFHRRAAAGALVGGVLGLVWLPSVAAAARIPANPQGRLVTDHNNGGNGHHNTTAMSVRSPIRNRGYQHTTNRNAGGVSDVQNALCHRARVCNLTQKVTIVNPERPAPTAVSVVPPRPAVVPDPATAARPRPAVVPAQAIAAPPPSAAGPLLAMGPYGLLLTGGRSAGADSAEDADGPARWLASWIGPFS
ncbi:hypothetical protein NE235_12330 [Actinoallomurus spadix]|uniref:hypothetical protein n=1 Tax=Actinoallomurus spadix TaxID=79912 RepID=UPI0020925A61|nr:hypothetical protein [Actinoallomurus spadix]MCO5986889.1 hypothetical protein [Actinoallomurus spadix]